MLNMRSNSISLSGETFRSFIIPTSARICALLASVNSLFSHNPRMPTSKMVLRLPTFALLAAVLGLSTWSVSAHPGEVQHAEHDARAPYQQLLAENGKRALAACDSSHHAQQLQDRAMTRRSAKLKQLRQLSSTTNHKSKLTGVTQPIPTRKCSLVRRQSAFSSPR